MDEQYDGFIDILVNRMVEMLSYNTEPEAGTPAQSGVVDRSFALTLSAWVAHLLQTSEDPSMTETVVKSCLLSSSTNCLALLDSLTKTDGQLAAQVRPLINVVRNADSGMVSLSPFSNHTEAEFSIYPQTMSIADDDAMDKLAEMEQRMLELDARMQVGRLCHLSWQQTDISTTAERGQASSEADERIFLGADGERMEARPGVEALSDRSSPRG